MKERKLKKASIAICIIMAIIVILIAFLTINSCSKKGYKITFIDSINDSVINTVTVKSGEKVVRPNDPKREGYVFDDWYYLNEPYDFSSIVKSDMTIEARFKASNGIVLNSDSIVLEINDTTKIEIESLPDGITLDDLIWQSSNESVLTVDENGNLKALKEGVAQVNVKTKDNLYSASCKVTVSKTVVAVESVKITGPTEVKVGNAIKLMATITPSNATDTNLSWESSNSKIATVDQNGNVKGISEGTVTITVKTNDGGKTATYKVTVKAKTSNVPSTPTNPEEKPQPPKEEKIPVNGVSISGETQVNVKSSIKLTATIDPDNATDKGVTWQSDNNSIATVDQNGTVTGVSEGTVTITVKTNDGGKTATYKVTVNSIYEIYLVKQILTGNEAAYYKMTVVKDGTVVNDYDYVQIKDARIFPGNEVMAELTDNETTSTATIKYNGKTSNAKIYYRAYN